MNPKTMYSDYIESDLYHNTTISADKAIGEQFAFNIDLAKGSSNINK